MFYIVWEFKIKKGKRRLFEFHYSARGTWAKFFSKSSEYVKSILIRDSKLPLRYLTIDVWKNSMSYKRFKRRYPARYQEIDQICEAYTKEERCIGFFEG